MSWELAPFNPEADLLESEAVERRAVRGVSILFSRSVLLLGITAFATIALARLLSPSEYGAFAIAVAIQALGRTAVELGMPVALVRKPEYPATAELRAMTGIMLVAGAALAALAALVCFVFLPLLGAGSEIATVTAIACFALPVFGLRSVPAVLLERRLNFGRLAAIEVSETVAFYSFALPAAALGLGAESLAGAVPVSAAVGVVVARMVQPWRGGASLDLAVLRPLLAFSAQTAALAPIYFARELGIVGALTISGGQALAGFYAMGQRLFAVPTAMMHAIWRVGVAGLARGESGESRERQATAAIATTLVAVGLPMATITGAADPLVEALFGSRWLPTADVVLLAWPGVLLMSSVGATLSGLLLADGDARSALIGELSGGLIAVALAGALGATMGAEAGGIAAGAGLTVIVVVMLLRSRLDRRRVASAVVRTLLAVGAAIAAGRLVPGDGLAQLASALAAAGACWLATTALLSRQDLSLLLELGRRHLPGVQRVWPPARTRRLDD